MTTCSAKTRLSVSGSVENSWVSDAVARVQTGSWELSSDILQKLRDATGETALMGRLIGSSGVVLQQSSSKHPIKVQVEIGTRFPLHTAAPAKAILAWLPKADCMAALAELKFKRFTEKTIGSLKEFELVLARCRKDGYSIDAGEEVEGITCIAAPYSTHCPGQSLLFGSRTRHASSKKQHTKIASDVMHHASLLSERLGYSP